MTSERLTILNMIADGRVTPEEGARLLEALNGGDSEPPPTTDLPQETSAPVGEASTVVVASPPNGNGNKPTRLRVRVTSKDGTGQKVHVNLPLSLIDIGLKIGGRFVPELEDFDAELGSIMEALKNDVHGKIVEVEDDGEHVEIFLE